MRAELYLFLASVLAALGWIASKLVVLNMPGEVFIAIRFLLAGLILLPFCYKRILRLSLKQLIMGCGVGVFLGVGFQVLIYAVSINHSLSEGAFIMSLAMIIAPVTAWIIFQVKPNRAFWFVLPISAIGMMLLTLGSTWQSDSSQLYFMLAAVFFSIHFVLNKNISRRLTPLVSICLQLFTVGIVGAIYVGFTQEYAFEFNRSLIFWFIISTVFATSMRYWLQITGQYLVNIETAAFIMILVPIWTMMLSVTVLGEALELHKVLGGCVILLSLFLYIRLSRQVALTSK